MDYESKEPQRHPRRESAREIREKDLIASVLAIVCVILFLWTGKMFIWNQSDDTLEQDSVPMAESFTLPPSLTTLDTSETTAALLTTGSSQTGETTDEFSAQNTTSPVPADSTSQTAANPSMVETTASSTTTTTTTAASVTIEGEAPQGYFSDALFIGDSRMVGLASFAPLPGAEYFATVGLATYKMDSAKNEVGSQKSLTFSELLSAKTYGKVYLMLGINEIGTDINTTMTKYQALIDRVRAAQPSAKIILMANLRVAASRSGTDAYVNNTRIDAFNSALSQLAAAQGLEYLDVNPLFDDGTGNLGTQYTNDGTHPVAKYYKVWSQWISAQAAND